VSVLQVKSRTPFDEAVFAKQKSEIRDRLLNYRQDAYFQEYIRRITEGLTKDGEDSHQIPKPTNRCRSSATDCFRGGLQAARFLHLFERLQVFMRHGCAPRAWGTAPKIDRIRVKRSGVVQGLPALLQTASNSRAFSPKPSAFVVLGPPASRPMPFTFFTEARRDGYEGRGLEFVPFSRFLK